MLERSPSAPWLHVTRLGGFDARLASGEALELRTRKSRALVAYLAMCPGRRHSRDVLAALLWSGWHDEHARANLRHTISEIRRALGPGREALRTGGSDVVLVSGSLTTAVDALERSVDGCARAGLAGAAPDPATTRLYDELRV